MKLTRIALYFDSPMLCEAKSAVELRSLLRMVSAQLNASY